MRKWIIVTVVAALVAGMIVPVTASAATSRGVRAKPVFVQHPYTARQRMKANVEFRTWGYVAPKVSDLSSRTVEILIYKRASARSWVATTSVGTTEPVKATMFNRARFRNRTMYEAKLTLSAPGRYRMRAKYTWKRADGTLVSRLSSYKYFRIVK